MIVPNISPESRLWFFCNLYDATRFLEGSQQQGMSATRSIYHTLARSLTAVIPWPSTGDSMPHSYFSSAILNHENADCLLRIASHRHNAQCGVLPRACGRGNWKSVGEFLLDRNEIISKTHFAWSAWLPPYTDSEDHWIKHMILDKATPEGLKVVFPEPVFPKVSSLLYTEELAGLPASPKSHVLLLAFDVQFLFDHEDEKIRTWTKFMAKMRDPFSRLDEAPKKPEPKEEPVIKIVSKPRMGADPAPGILGSREALTEELLALDKMIAQAKGFTNPYVLNALSKRKELLQELLATLAVRIDYTDNGRQVFQASAPHIDARLEAAKLPASKHLFEKSFAAIVGRLNVAFKLLGYKLSLGLPTDTRGKRKYRRIEIKNTVTRKVVYETGEYEQTAIYHVLQGMLCGLILAIEETPDH